MRANTWIACNASRENGIINFIALSGCKLVLLGSSMRHPLGTGGDHKCYNIPIAISPGDKGVVAIKAYTPKGSNETFLISVDFSFPRSTPHVMLEDSWIPEFPDRLGAVSTDDLHVEISGMHFTTCRDSTNRALTVSGDVLCCYLTGSLSPQQVMDSAGTTPQQLESLLEIWRLRKQINEHETETATLRQQALEADENKKTVKRIKECIRTMSGEWKTKFSVEPPPESAGPVDTQLLHFFTLAAGLTAMKIDEIHTLEKPLQDLASAFRRPWKIWKLVMAMKNVIGLSKAIQDHTEPVSEPLN